VTEIVTLLTDFGTADGYVAEVKGVLLSRAPGCAVVDLTHDIEPGDVAAAAWAIARAWRTFPPGTVHLCVVDPGVGTARRAIAVEADRRFLVGPDNGLFSKVFEAGPVRVVAMPVPPHAAPTFHGRDVFAPAAAALARGEPLDALGTILPDPVRLAAPRHTVVGEQVVGEVVHVDRFGTLVTSIPAARIAEHAAVRIGAYDLVLSTTFADVGTGEPVAFVGSGGTLEIAVRDGRADAVLGQGRGAEVRVTARPPRGPRARPSTGG
jgi:hypothetical protein